MSALTATDLFCGAGGSSLGARYAGVQLLMAANHWQTAIDVHQAHFPEAGHDVADISQADPRRYPRTDILLASPECTNHSQARGVSRKRQDPSLWDAPDPSAERSRATMWDVFRFAEQLLYDVIVVENVVEATKWVGWRGWHVAMADLGYEHRVISTNSMHHGVPQSRDRIYVVFWRKGLRLNLDMETMAWCATCDAERAAVQAWKNGRTVGRYGPQWIWVCTSCGKEAKPATLGAVEIIDWALPCPRIGDRKRPLAKATRARILAGLQRYGWAPITTTGAGNVHERTPGNRARPLTEPLPTQQTTATSALATPPAFGLNTAHGGRIHDLEQPHPTVCASDDRMSLVVPMRRNGHAATIDEPVPTVTAGGNHHGLVVTNDHANRARTPDEPLPTVTTGNRHGLVVRMTGFQGSGPLGRFTNTPEDPLPTVVTTQRPALVMRNNTGAAEMVTPAEEPVRTVTKAGHQSLLMPYYGHGQAQPVDRPVPTVPTKDRFALVDLEAIVDDCGFRMFEPHEIAAAMAFPTGYIPEDLPKVTRVKLAGNAVTPPVMQWIVGRVREALGAA